MEEIYRLIEEKIKNAGYNGPVSGEEIYDEICDEIEDKENGSYIFMSKKEDDVLFEYKIDVMDENFNLSYIDIVTPVGKVHIDFDEK
ncbi:hypothetical protein JGS6364_13621 [[Clostridium] sordellii]|uniref:PepSY domain-containing protein n=1 Tax=Paraclostridium sordellii TaxID=1505 RepID=A0ABM9RLS1_PARSO|nr:MULTISPECIES: hypothetical protein [Paeniclostridium]MDU5020817.1 hypothetical protein [Clostridiales bacterium]AUN13640.1 hypothetical protein RSJ16_05120 [Paeniclostridium sordellii]EPZ58007.1 hypothetical protein H476_1491 [[Clostridium] sordellii VPI 9048] [Paeniclostridium sordellii VPI 9048]MBS6023582.1 hypothetical protein [Paeniclostridium sordellii]MBW4863492.1 hypothetical protein [Paeniclostridium sp.]